ncbi:MAG: phosphoribosylformylglycinamidine synthase subunit PurL [Alphaproteobacteria bacterium]|nr:phosphoribosylformylglycinamidine synthase subunit PurL [Alphaproteobacteria bacterium]
MTAAPAKNHEAPAIREPDVTPELAAEYGLSREEYEHIVRILSREPSHTELGIFSVMWSEHCSYKSSRIHLKKLPTQAPWVIQGPGENAGVIDIGDNQAAIFKMESHNHPSFIEPYQGAATGVGGIMRDVFTMGARPIANLNALRFGEPSHPKTRHLVSGVVAGIAGYGNCMGVPTVGGETQFHPSYNGNILVNAMTIGLADQDAIYYSRGAKPDMPVVYVGSKTGRDGIHGATMASAEFGDGNEENRPTVQVGDPFTEKLLLEACLELMETDAIVCIQDMGAAGLTSSTVEIADKGEIGVTLELDKVPQRERMMTPYELMLSESQERMLMVLEPGKEHIAEAIFKKWDLDFAVIGYTTVERRLKLTMYGKEWCDIPVPPLVNDAPVYDRPTCAYQKAEAIDDAAYAALPPSNSPLFKEEGRKRSDASAIDSLAVLIACPDMADKRWIWEQYDSLVMGESVFTPGITGTQNGKAADAALIRVSSDKALATASDCNPRYCKADPFEGGKQAVAESYRNISAVGATPLAVTNNLNFGNPEKPHIMAQFVGCIEGMAASCQALDYPVISGNVSLYNETAGTAILPTPVIGGVGLIPDWSKAMDIAFKNADDAILLIGGTGTHLGQSLFLKEVYGKEIGLPPRVDLDRERKHGEFIRALIDGMLVNACHDISDGGLLCTIAEMAIAGNMGADLRVEPGNNPVAFWFGEDQARYVVTAPMSDVIVAQAKEANIPCTVLGHTKAGSLRLADGGAIDIEKLRTLHTSWLPDFMR